MRLDEDESSRRTDGPGQIFKMYDGAAIVPNGFQASAESQRLMVDLLDEAYGGFFEKEFNIALSPRDAAVFADERCLRNADTYGEIRPAGALDMFWRIGAKPGDRFYDLGAGPGKIVALAWMLGMQATGIELSRARWHASCTALAAMAGMQRRGCIPQGDSAHGVLPELCPNGPEYLHGSFQGLDFTDADIVLFCSVLFPRELLEDVTAIARWMKPGSRIISYEGLRGPEFKQLGEFVTITSWTRCTSFIVQEVVGNPSSDEVKPSDLRRPDKYGPMERRSFAELNVAAASTDCFIRRRCIY